MSSADRDRVKGDGIITNDPSWRLRDRVPDKDPLGLDSAT